MTLHTTSTIDVSETVAVHTVVVTDPDGRQGGSRVQYEIRCYACGYWDVTDDRDAAIRDGQEHECNLDEVSL